MGVSTPPLDLTGHCSAIFDNTLYLYSPAGFQSLPLSKNATWNVLPPGTSVQGGVCVNAIGPNEGAPGLYIVGGRANSTSQDYPGLQKFTYATQQWETIKSEVPVSQNRQNHGAAYLNATSSIVVYAGSQDPSNSNPSSQTFLISTKPPYTTLSYLSIAPPLTQPMLMPWNDTHAVMVGGNNNNKAIYVFSANGWADLGTSLTEPLSDDMTIMCSIATGDDGSKVLEKYNLGVSPNIVSRFLLYAGGKPAPAGIAVGAGRTTRAKRYIKRQLTADNWPAYDPSKAPTTKRSGFSIAQSPDGLTVVSGGGPANDPVQLFQERQNTWVDVNAVFGSQTPLTPSSTASSTSSVTSSASATSTSTAAPSSKNKALTVLGGALGGVLGFAALLIIILLLLRWHADRARRKEEKKREATEKEARLSFADQGADFMRDAHGVRGPNAENTQSMVGSISSLQIFAGKSGQNGHKRGQHSDSSQLGLTQHSRPMGGTDELELSRVNNDRLSPPSTAGRMNSPYGAEGPLDRSTGWSQYFNGNQNFTNLATPAAVGASPQTFLQPTSVRSSDLSASEYHDNVSRQPSTAQPFNINNMNTGFTALPQPSTTGPHYGGGSSTPAAGRVISSSSYNPSHWSLLSEDRASVDSSILTAFPSIAGSGPAGNAFASPDNPLTGSSREASRPITPVQAAAIPSARDFPMPQGYYPPNPAPPPVIALPAMPRFSTRMEPESPAPRPTQRGPVLRKMTGSEDMSWLNINAGRPI